MRCLIACFPFFLLNCNQSSTNDLLNADFSGSLVVSPASTTLAAGESVTLKAYGGTKPYTFSLESGKGTVTAGGAYTAGIVGSTDLVKVSDASMKFAYATIQVNTVKVQPQNAGGMLLWLKADAGISTTGNLIDSWADQSGNARNVTGTGGNRPVYETGVMGTQPAATFASTNSNFLTFADVSFVRGVSYSMFIVYKIPSCTGTNRHFIGGTGNTADTNFYVGYNTCSSVIHGYWTHDLGGNASPGGNPEILFLSHDYATFATLISINGQTKALGSNNGSLAAGIVAGLAIGRFTTNYFDGSIAEILIYNSVLSDATRDGILCNLAQKYGVTVANCG